MFCTPVIRKNCLFLLVICWVCLITAGCTQKVEQSKTGGQPVERTVIIGFTASQTGKFNVESTRQINGLNLWIEQVNSSGGIRLGDGTKIKFAARFYDDESNKDRVQELYTKLISQDKAEFLISPYSSGLADASAMIAEQYSKLIITAGAASDSTHSKGYNLVYQVYTPASRYLTGAFNMLSKLDEKAHNAVLIYEKDKFSTEVCAAANKYGAEKGFKISLFEGYDSGATDFAPFINKIPKGTDAVMGGGHFADGTTFAKQLFEKGVKAKFISLLVAPPEPKFAELGNAAVGIIGPSQWEPLAKYSSELSHLAGQGAEWFGPNISEFVAAYKNKYQEEPSYHGAGGYAAALILQKAIIAAGSLDTQKVKAELDKLNLMIFFGRIQFDTTPQMHGLQKGHEMVYIQWQKDAQGKLVKQVVWPEEAKSANALYPAH